VYEDMKLVPQFFHVDLMLACIGGHFTMDPVRAALAVELVKPKQVIPMHFGTFPLVGGTPDQFRDALAKRGLADKLIIMKPGESRAF
jgi:L-ascorbate metabolism protein UlaG (beta-lactamase superfamily)